MAAAVKQIGSKISSGAVLQAAGAVASPSLGRAVGAASSRVPYRTVITKPTGEYLPKPNRAPFGLLGAAATVSVGLMLGATISKNMASFLEENELFVPTDDDDDD